MQPLPPTVDEVLAELADDSKPWLSSSLTELSNLKADELGKFEKTWASLDIVRRHKLMNQLVELAENNFELNFDGIYKIALKDKDPDIRTKAIEGLWEDEEPSLISCFIKLLTEDSSEKVQAAAATALGKFAMMAELNKLRSAHAQRVSDALLNVLGDNHKGTEVRRRVLEAAAPLSLPQVKEYIKKAYIDSDTRSKASALNAMGKNCDAVWLPILLRELNNPNPEIRYESVIACGELCDKEAVPQLLKLVDDEDTEVQMAAITALGKIGGAKAKRCLQKCVQSPDDAVCQAAEDALQQMEAEEGFPV